MGHLRIHGLLLLRLGLEVSFQVRYLVSEGLLDHLLLGLVYFSLDLLLNLCIDLPLKPLNLFL